MKNSKLIKIGSFMLCATLLAGVLVAPQKVSASTEQVTHVDFDSMSSLDEMFSLGEDTPAASEYWKTYATIDPLSEGGKALHLKGGAEKQHTLFMSEGWKDNTRPTEVQYRFKVVSDKTTTLNKDAYIFRPIYHAKTDGVCFPIKLIAQTRASATKSQFSVGSAWPKKVTVTSNATTNVQWAIATTETASPWIQATITYDWSKYTENDGYVLSLRMLMTNSITGETVANISMTTSDGTGGTDAEKNLMTKIAEKTKYIAFSTGTANIAGLDTWIDDIYVWSEDFTTGETYGPTVSPVATGATLSNVVDNKVKVKMNFDFTSAKALIEKNGETVQKYGAVLVAGTKDSATMQSKAATMIADGLSDSDGYKRTEKTGELADQYSITITNSCETDTMGKRASAIGYVVTDKGIYYTNNTVANKVTNGVINKSVMGLLKSIFAVTYLTDFDAQIAEGSSIEATRLGIALNACGYEVNNDTVDNIRAITTKSGSTATEKQQLLTLHIALMSE